MCNQRDRLTATIDAVQGFIANTQPFSAFDVTQRVRAAYPSDRIDHAEIRLLVKGAMALQMRQSATAWETRHDPRGFTLYGPVAPQCVPANGDPNEEPDFGTDDEDEGEPNVAGRIGDAFVEGPVFLVATSPASVEWDDDGEPLPNGERMHIGRY